MFSPRAFETILTDMVAHIRANTALTDFSVGSAIRTILESAALEDDEQYYQMVQLLDDFSFNSASGTDLDKRAADFNIGRLESAPASGHIRYLNDALTTNSLQFSVLATASIVFLKKSDDFPISGFPYSVRIGEGTPQVEDVIVLANDTVTEKLTTSALVNDHSVGDRVSLISGSAIPVPSGVQIQVAAQGDNLPIIFQAKEAATLAAGDYYSNLVSIVSSDNGTINNIGVGSISQFVGSPPFPGASVTNPTNTNGGRDRETDREFRSRIRLHIQSLAKGTKVAIEGSVIGVEDPISGQRVVSAKLVESFTDLEHKLYIDDGTGLISTTVIMGHSAVRTASPPGPYPPLLVGATAIPVSSVGNFPASGYIIISPENTSQVEVLHYSSKDIAVSRLVLDALTVTAKQHDHGDEVLLVDYLGTAELGQNYFQLTQYPARKNTMELYDDSTGVGSFKLRSDNTDYFLNRTNGQIEYYGIGLPSGTRVYANYVYYTGLLALVQKIINGDPSDTTNYPGVVAGGIIIYVDVPNVRHIAALASIAVDVGYDEDTLRDSVKLAIENYIDGLSIGENVIISKMVERAFTVEGVANVIIKSPISDIVILENELPKSYDSSGNSLVRVI
jgi:uncharacterized phage protein gp47/JayE